MDHQARTIALIGNAGVGKTSLFERLYRGSPRPRKVPGSDVEVSEAPLARAVVPTFVVDTPGTVLLSAKGPVECAARDLVMAGQADALAVVADAKSLRRSLVLFLHAAEFRLPTVLVLNMMDEAQRMGLEYDLDRLADLLTVETIPLADIEGRVSEKMAAAFERARVPSIRITYPKEVENALESLGTLFQDAPVPPRALALLLLAGDARAGQMLEERFPPDLANSAKEVVQKTREAFANPLELAITNSLYKEAERIAGEVTHRSEPGMDVLQRIGGWASSPFTGLPIALLVMIAGFLWVGVLGATITVDFIKQKIFGGLLLPLCGNIIDWWPVPLIRDAIMDPNFGLLPTGLFLALGLVLPVLFFFYVFFGILEDSGYLSRLSVLMDRSMRMIGLTGKGVLPLVFGFSCITMALLTTRMLSTRKERIIASFLLLLSIPCAPLLAVMLVALKPLHWTAAATLMGVFLIQALAAGVLANLVLPGGRSDFILELPPIRVPRIWAVTNRARQLSLLFIKDALPAFIGASLLLFVLDRLGALKAFEHVAHPVVGGMMGLPDEAVQVFLKTIVRREAGAAELIVLKDNFTPVQLVVTLFVMTVVMPCTNSAIVLIKEQGVKIAAFLILVISVYGVLAGAVFSWTCHALGVTFQ